MKYLFNRRKKLMKKKPYEYLFEIGLIISKKEKIELDSKKLKALTKQFVNHSNIKSYELTHEEALCIAIKWHDEIFEHSFSLEANDILKKLFPDPIMQFNKTDIIANLLKKKIFYTDSKELSSGERKSLNEIGLDRINKVSLFRCDIEFHREFTQLLLQEKKSLIKQLNKPYKSNKEFLRDWFHYLDKIEELENYDPFDEKLFSSLKDLNGKDQMEIEDWKKRIARRSKNTEQVFPLQDITQEYMLDEKEVLILMYLAKNELNNNDCDTDDLLKLISSDFQDLYRNKEYVSSNARLIKNGLIELSEGVFFMNRVSEVRIAPDVLRRIIMRNPVNEEDKIHNILQHEDIFTLYEPSQTFSDLILPNAIKKNIDYAMQQYSAGVNSTLRKWGLLENKMLNSGVRKEKNEASLLMLFYGLPGTGKTFAAGAVANALGKKLLVTDISRISSKWVGDSEKNVKRIFTVFQRIVNKVDNPPVLFFNEADQFLTKRMQKVDSSVEKMMNSMQNLFLEGFENFQGILIATTNLRSNLDEAFSRRFHLKLKFPMPKLEQRKKLWELYIKDSIPRSKEIDIKYLSERYLLTGGQIKLIIKNACVEAATRKGNSKKLMQKDLIKYCDLENNSQFTQNRIVGFGG